MRANLLLSLCLGIISPVESAADPWSVGQLGTYRTNDNILFGFPISLPDNSSASIAACYGLCASAPGCVAWSMTLCPAPGAQPQCIGKWATGQANLDPTNCTTSGLVEQATTAPSHLRLPAGAVQPTGWLGAQLQLEADGLTGHLADFYPDVANSSWIGGRGDGAPQERAPYWLRGAVPLAHALGDARLVAQVSRYIDYALTHAQPSGWLGPDMGGDRQYWGRYPFMNALQFHYEATRDARIPAAMIAYLKEQRRRMWTQPLGTMWSASRVHDLMVAVAWLLDSTEEGAAEAPFLFEFADMVWLQRGAFDWETYFASRDFPAGPVGNPYGNNTVTRLILHGVDVAEALKSGAVWWRFWGAPELLEGSLARAAKVEALQGLPTGEVCADEHLCGTMPSQATELCAIVEQIASYGYIAEAAGSVAFYERMERLAFNTLPATYTKDMTAHPYLHQSNEIRAVNVNPPPWLTDGGGANIYGIDAGRTVGCCTTNGGQGWPQTLGGVLHATGDGGIALGVFAPVTALVQLRQHQQAWKGSAAVGARWGGSSPPAHSAPKGRAAYLPSNVTVTVTTDYPFNDTLTIVLEGVPSGGCPLHLRIPSWADLGGAALELNGVLQAIPPPALGAFFPLALPAGTSRVTFFTAPRILLTPSYNGSVVVSRGALIYSLFLNESVSVDSVPFPDFPAGKNYHVLPQAPWNYALIIANTSQPENSFNFTRSAPPGPQPFAGGDSVPVSMTAWARRVGAWGEFRNGAGPPPASPVCSRPEDQCGEPELVTLVPHGSTLLRMTALPFALS